jgi:hypothetical protein
MSSESKEIPTTNNKPNIPTLSNIPIINPSTTSSTKKTCDNTSCSNLNEYLNQLHPNDLHKKLTEILEKVNYIDNRVHKTNYQKSSDLVTKYFDSNSDSIGLQIIGWLLMGIWYYFFKQFFHFLFILLKFLFYLFIFLLIFVPLMCIGLVFLILILVMINIWMSSKSFIDALIQVINPLIPVPLVIWNIIAAVFNAIGALARKFGGRLPKMPTVRNPNRYKIKKGMPSIYAIIDYIVKPLKAKAWKEVENHIDD